MCSSILVQLGKNPSVLSKLLQEQSNCSLLPENGDKLIQDNITSQPDNVTSQSSDISLQSSDVVSQSGDVVSQSGDVTSLSEESGCGLTPDVLSQLPYLDQTWKEVGRIAPPFGGCFRQVIKTFELEVNYLHPVTYDTIAYDTVAYDTVAYDTVKLITNTLKYVLKYKSQLEHCHHYAVHAIILPL